MNYLKLVAITFLIFLISACGSFQPMSQGIEEDNRLVIRGHRLVGLTVSIDDEFTLQILKSDLEPFKLGVLGATDSDAEDMQTIVLKVDAGMRLVKVRKGSSVIVQRSLQFSQGQTREIVL
jgi:hypothetical protein